MPQLRSEAFIKTLAVVGSDEETTPAIIDALGFLVNFAFSPSSPSWIVSAERRLEVSENSREHPPETPGVPSVQKDRVESSRGTSFSVSCFISSSCRSTTAFVIDSDGKTLW